MRRIRLFHDAPLKTNDTIALMPEAVRHLIQVLRKNVGDECWLFNAENGEYRCIIESVSKKAVTVRALEFHECHNESPVSIHLGQGLSRGERMDYAIQKAVELGVNEITPLVSVFSQVKLSKERMIKRLQHWHSIAISACEQSGRCAVPVIHPPLSIHDFTNLTADVKLICCPRHPGVSQSINDSLPFKILVAIGPEGGFSNDEVVSALSSGFEPLALGPRVLRTETATVAALSILQSRFEQWG